MVVCGVSLGLEGSAGRVSDGVGCIGIVRDNVVSSGNKLLVRWPCGGHMGLGRVSIGRGRGRVCVCMRVWRGEEKRVGMVVVDCCGCVMDTT